MSLFAVARLFMNIFLVAQWLLLSEDDVAIDVFFQFDKSTAKMERRNSMICRPKQLAAKKDCRYTIHNMGGI